MDFKLSWLSPWGETEFSYASRQGLDEEIARITAVNGPVNIRIEAL